MPHWSTGFRSKAELKLLHYSSSRPDRLVSGIQTSSWHCEEGTTSYPVLIFSCPGGCLKCTGAVPTHSLGARHRLSSVVPTFLERQHTEKLSDDVLREPVASEELFFYRTAPSDFLGHVVVVAVSSVGNAPLKMLHAGRGRQTQKRPTSPPRPFERRPCCNNALSQCQASPAADFNGFEPQQT